MSATADLVKSKVERHRTLMKSQSARKFLAKRQRKRGGSERTPDGMYRLQAPQYDGNKNPNELAKADGYIRTIHDLVDYHYGFVPQHFAKKSDSFGKADDTLTSTTAPGYNNVVYGQEVYSLLNSETNIFSLIGTRPWRKSGERVILKRDRTLGEGGHAENEALPDTNHPEIAEYEQTVESIAHNFDVSQEQQLLSDTNDDRLNDPFDFIRRYYGTGTQNQEEGEHPKHINAQLGSPATRDESANALFENAFIPIDRLVSAQNEVNNTSVTASDANVFGFDRSSGEFEANVLENSGDDRPVTINLLDEAITAVRQSSGKEPVSNNDYFFLTGHDTFELLEEEVGSKERLEPVRATTGLNGVQTNAGDDVGITVQSYKDIPIFRTNDLVSDTVSRIFLLDSTSLYMKQLLPTQFYSTGINVDDNPFALDRRANEGMFLTMGQTTITNPNACAKIRDLL